MFPLNVGLDLIHAICRERKPGRMSLLESIIRLSFYRTVAVILHFRYFSNLIDTNRILRATSSKNQAKSQFRGSS